MSTTGTQPKQVPVAEASPVVPPSYKQTKVGVIPKEWEVMTVGSVVRQLHAGVSVNSVDDDLTGDIGEPAILKTSSVKSGAFLPQEAKRIAPRDLARAKLNPRENTILISRMNTLDLVGECGFVDRDYPYLFIPDRLWMTQFVPGSAVSVLWLSYVLSSPEYKKQLQAIATGTSGSMKNIAKDSLLGLPIAFPDPTEQHAIAEALSDVDGLIGALEKVIAKKRAIKQAAMQQLLTGKTRLPGFGGEWGTKRVSEFGEIVTGGTPRTDIAVFWGEGYPWITPTDISSHRDMVSSERMITQEGLDSIRTLPANTVLVTCIASIGKNAILKTKGGCNQQINAVIPNPAHSADFLYYLFEANAQYLLANAGTTATSIVSKATFSELAFEVPPLPEQSAIATVLSDMDAEITSLERRRDKTKQIKQGMMQQLLTGRVRLVNPPDAEAHA